jgi:hypothetical protein
MVVVGSVAVSVEWQTSGWRWRSQEATVVSVPLVVVGWHD